MTHPLLYFAARLLGEMSDYDEYQYEKFHLLHPQLRHRRYGRSSSTPIILRQNGS